MSNKQTDSLTIGTESHNNSGQQKGGSLSGPWTGFWNRKKIDTDDKAIVALNKGNFDVVAFFIDEDMITDYGKILHSIINANKPDLFEKALDK
jgi:hypothetical protein